MTHQRYRLTIAYRGTRYHGWQHQAANEFWKGPMPAAGHGIPTIQETLSRTIASIVGHPVRLVGSSRTDTGVHAKGQVAHFDTDQPQIPPVRLCRAVNNRLPEDIIVRAIEAVPPSFDAIASTVSKRYQYLVWNAPDRPIFFADLAFYRWQRLDVAAMSAAAAAFVGEHDFASFARPGHGRLTTIRTVHSCQVSGLGPRIVIGVEGSGFLWHQVRIMAGTLVEVGLGRFGPEEVPQMLAARDRRSAGSTAPPHGLYLQWVKTMDEPASPLPDMDALDS